MAIAKQDKTKPRSLAATVAVMAAAVLLAIGVGVLAGCASSSGSGSGSSTSASSSAASGSSASSAGVQLQVPNLVSLTRDDATKLLTQLGFSMVEIRTENSDTVAKNHVIAQKPDALSMVDAATTIELVISSGKKEAATVEVPNIIGMSQSQAEQALTNAGLVPIADNPVVSSAVDPGKVCKQSVKAGDKVKEGTKVAFSTALAEDNVTVPAVEGKSYNDAKAALEGAGLGVDPSSAYSNTVDKDNVISQSVPANTKVAKGTVVKVVVSQGAKPAEKVQVPYVMTATLDEAIAALNSAGLKYRYSGDDDGTVVAMDPAAGTEVEVGTTVNLTLERASELVAVPDVSGMMGSDARAACDLVGLTLDYDVRHPDRVVDYTEPAAGTMVEAGSFIEAGYNDPPVVTDWTDAASADAAVKGSGLASFKVPNSFTYKDITFANPKFAYVSGIVRATYESAASAVEIRKGAGAAGTYYPGDDRDYEARWVYQYSGSSINCYGHEDGKAILIEWNNGNDAYAVKTIGLGGEDVPMNKDIINKCVDSVR